MLFHSITPAFLDAIKRKTFFIFCLILILMGIYPCLKYIWGNMVEEGANIATCSFLIIIYLVLLPILYRYSKNKNHPELLFLLPLAAICSICAVPSIIHRLTDWMLSTIYITGIFAATYAIFRRWCLIFWFLWLILPFGMNLAAQRYQIKIDAHLITEIIGASPQDADKFLSLSNITLFLGFILGTSGLLFLIIQSIKNVQRKHLLATGMTCILLVLATSAACERPLWDRYAPRVPEYTIMNILNAYEISRSLQSNLERTNKRLPSSATPAPFLPEENISKECICILHIGESVRSDHLSLFGYPKPTTPNLDRMNRLIGFRDCTSVAPSTVPSTFAILTNAKTDIREQGIDDSLGATCGGIMDIFHALHFSCYAFINQEDKNEAWGARYEKLLSTTFASSADKILSKPDYGDSHVQIAQLAEAIQKEANKHIFCFVNNTGSHLPFTEYDVQHPPFNPASHKAYDRKPDKNAKVAETVCNTYDCTIHYWDAYVYKLLNQLEGRPYIYIYISDHGEYLGDKGIWVRNGDKQAFFNTPVCQVPFLIITSPEFEQQNPHYKEALQTLKTHSDMSIGQGHIFHTILGIFGIQSPYYEEELDLTSDKVQPYSGPHPSRGGKASDGKKWY